MLKYKKGGIAIESAISFSLVLIFVASIINVINIYRTDIIMQRSVTEVVNSIEFYAPLTIIPSDGVYIASELMTDEQNSTFINDINRISNSFSEVFNIENFTSEILTLSFSRQLETQILNKYVEINGTSFYKPENIYVDLIYNQSQKVIYVEVTYSLLTITGEVSRNISSVIPFWGDYIEFERNLDDEMNNSEFWNLSNFERGNWLREHFNANLPQTFPVINRYENGNVLSVTSIDLNASRYSSQNRLENRLTDEVNSLSSFDGADVVINGNRYTINGEEIHNRYLMIVIPENSPEELRDIVYSYVDFGIESNVKVQVIEMGDS